MGAKLVSLMTPTATVNTNGIECKTDTDCTNGKGTYGVNKTAVTAITTTLGLAETCCMHNEYVKAPSGTTAEIAAGDALLLTYK